MALPDNNARAREWARWLRAAGLATGHVAFVLGLELGQVEALYADFDRPGRQGPKPRHRRPEPPGRAGIRGEASLRVRRLRSLGYDPGRIAELTGTDPAELADYLARITPRGDTDGIDLARPRTRREQAGCRRRRGRYRPRPRALGEWGPVRDDGDLAVEIEHRADAPGPEMPAQSHGPIADAPAAAVPLAWGPFQERWARGEKCGASKLTDDEARRMRTLRAEGLTRRELSEAFGVSMATVGRVLAGRTYRDAMPRADDDLVEQLPPATSPVPAVEQGNRWEEPPGDRRRRGDD